MKTLRTCKFGHQYYKSTDCPTCPFCEKKRKTPTGFFAALSAPARRALENKNINTLKQLSKFSVKELLKFHGIGPSSIPILKTVLKEKGLSFKD